MELDSGDRAARAGRGRLLLTNPLADFVCGDAPMKPAVSSTSYSVRLLVNRHLLAGGLSFVASKAIVAHSRRTSAPRSRPRGSGQEFRGRPDTSATAARLLGTAPALAPARQAERRARSVPSRASSSFSPGFCALTPARDLAPRGKSGRKRTIRVEPGPHPPSGRHRPRRSRSWS
jgi:hypothetical protein